MAERTQGVALGYSIRPRWGRNSRVCVGGGSGVRGLGWDGLVCNGPNGARGDSPGQGPGVPRRIMGALKGRNGVWTVGRCEPGGIAGACGARAAGSEIRPYLKGALWRRGRIGEGGIPPLQGGNRMTGRTQGFALGYCIRPRWGRNSRGVRRGACVGGRAWWIRRGWGVRRGACVGGRASGGGTGVRGGSGVGGACVGGRAW